MNKNVFIRVSADDKELLGILGSIEASIDDLSHKCRELRTLISCEQESTADSEQRSCREQN